MKKIILLTVSILVFTCCTVFAENFSLDKLQGSYIYTEKGDELIDGQYARITWRIAISSDTQTHVDISSWHTLYSCDGNYIVQRTKQGASLTWDKKNNPDTTCDTDGPQFLLKESQKGQTLVKSPLFNDEGHDWKLIKKVR